MDMAKLHEPFKGKDSPSVETQRNWLRKKGFTPIQIDKAMLTLYSDMARGALPQVFEGAKEISKKEVFYGMAEDAPPSGFIARPIATGTELDQTLLKYASFFKTEDDQQEIIRVQQFEKMLRKRWESQVPWYKRVFGIKPKPMEDTE
jgi:hypothetical protein